MQAFENGVSYPETGILFPTKVERRNVSGTLIFLLTIHGCASSAHTVDPAPAGIQGSDNIHRASDRIAPGRWRPGTHVLLAKPYGAGRNVPGMAASEGGSSRISARRGPCSVRHRDRLHRRAGSR